MNHNTAKPAQPMNRFLGILLGSKIPIHVPRVWRYEQCPGPALFLSDEFSNLGIGMPILVPFRHEMPHGTERSIHGYIGLDGNHIANKGHRRPQGATTTKRMSNTLNRNGWLRGHLWPPYVHTDGIPTVTSEIQEVDAQKYTLGCHVQI